MKNVITALALTCAMLFASNTAAQEAKGPLTGLSNAPSVLNPGTITRTTKTGVSKIHSHKMASLETIQSLRNIKPNRDGKRALNVIDSSENSRLGLTTGNLYRSFEGLSHSGAPAPPDPYIAAGVDHVVVVVNSRLAVYDKEGSPEFVEYLSDWFSDVHPPNFLNEPFDPRVIFDHHANHFVIIAVARDADQASYYLLSVSQTSDPNGQWWNYRMNAKINGNQDPDDVWADYPDIGFDVQAVYLTSNQFDWTFFEEPQYNKVRIFKKTELYTGQPLTFVDFWGLTNIDASRAFTVKPAHHYSNSTSAYLVNTKWEGWDRLTVWRIDNPAGGSPSLVRHATHFVESYVMPPTAPQLGSTVTIETQDCRAMNAVYRDGYIHTTFTEGYDWESDGNEATVRYVKISTVPLESVEFDVRYGANELYYYHPAVYLDNDGNVVWLFNRSSEQEYAGIRYAFTIPESPDFSESASLKPGESHYTFGGQEAEFGDYSGLALDPIEGSLWMHSEYAIATDTWGTWIGAFSPNVPVRFRNIITGQTASGTLRLDEAIDIGSGSFVTLTPNSSHTIRTLNERYINYQGAGITYKHHDWNGVATEHKLAHEFPVPEQGSLFQDANFQRLDPISVRAELIDGGTGSFWFRDPWWVSNPETGEQPDIFREFPTQMDSGVFLNQNPNIPGNPYYSARVPLSQDIAGHPANFLDWQATGADLPNDPGPPPPAGYTQKAVVFTSANAEVAARYKWHLASSSPSVTAPNGQRKVVRDNNGNYHMAYESGGEIFYTRSTDGGATWSPERHVSDFTPVYPYNRSPSLTVQDNPHQVIVVWDASANNPSEFVYVVARAIDPVTGSFGAKEDVEVHWLDPAVVGSSMPVVGSGINTAGERYTLAVWYDPIDQKLRGRARSTNGSWSQYATDLDDGVISSITLVPINKSDYPRWGCAWVKDRSLYYMEINVAATVTAGTIETVAVGTDEIENLNSSLARGAGAYPFIGLSWEEYNEDIIYRVVKYREKQKDYPWSSTVYTWASGSSFTPYNTPTYSTQQSSGTGNAVIVWRSGTSQLKYVKRVSGSWSAQTNLATGVDPSLSVGWTNPNSERVLWRGTALPYPVGQTTITYGGSQGLPLAGTKLDGFTSPEGRGGKIVFERGTLHLAVLKASLDNIPITFTELNDTIPISNSEEFASALTTEPFAGSGTLHLSLLYTASGELPASARFAGLLLDAGTGQVLASVRSFKGLRDTVVSLSIPLRFSGKMVQLALRPEVSANPRSYEIERWYVDAEGESDVKPTAQMPTDVNPIPIAFDLRQNYPNPFNPSTVIRYQLPVEGYVSLKVYDLLGREVATLVNEAKEAGYYEAVFDASSLGSGVYFFRMHAGEFNAVRKLVVVK